MATTQTERVVYPATATYTDDEGHQFSDDALAVIDVRPCSIRTKVYDLDTGKDARKFSNYVRWDLA